MKPNVFIAVDLETTGLDFENDEIIEIAMERFENGVSVDSRDFLVKPKQTLRSFITTLTGITNEELASAEDFASLAGKVREFIGDIPLVAHNSQFDFKFLKNAFATVGIAFESHPVFDTLLLSRIAFQDVPNHRLETLVKHLGIEREKAHRALPDADACGKLFCLALHEVEKFSAFEKYHLHNLSLGTVWESVFDAVTPDHTILNAEDPEDIPAPMGNKTPYMPRIREFFGAEGKLSKILPDFVAREAQVDYAEIVERNMYKGGLSILEAGTGTGKTLAYLLPAALKAAAGERVVISTATRALQEQLWQRDLPSIASLLEGKVSATVLKGRGNYICYRKFQEHLDFTDTLLASDERETFMTLLPWVERTSTGDGNENTGFNLNRNRALWAKISSDASTCTGERCPFFSKCPGLSARRRASKANLVFINHSLFLADLALDFALLPAYDHIVFDEAHRLPNLSHHSFGRSLRFFRLRNIFKTLVHMKAEDKGLIAEIERKIVALEKPSAELQPLCARLRSDVSETEKQLHRFFLKLGKKVGKRKDNNFRFTQGIFAEFDADPKAVLDALVGLKATSDSLVTLLREEKTLEGLARDLDGIISDTVHFADDFDFISKGNREDWVFYLEEPFNPHTVIMNAMPLDPGKIWAEKFYPWIKSATFTSATLSVQGTLDYYIAQMGMNSENLPAGKRPFTRIYEAPFDVNAKRTVLIANFLPKPNDPEYQAALENVLCSILPPNKRNTLALFTSIVSMTKVHSALMPLFAEKNKLLLSQHVDGGMDSLVEMFRKERESCLLGCQVFWEGIDLPGDALELLVIPKLPFPNPGDPLVASKADRMKEKGENAFRNLFVPEALLELRQGMGRLIRGEGDSGVLLLLDNRLVTEAYGKSFTRLWGNNHTVVQSLEELKAKLGV